MATIGTDFVTLADIVAQTEPDGSISRDIASRVARTNQLLQFLPFKEGNKPDGNQIVQLVKLPVVGYIKYNKAPTKSKAGHNQITDQVGTIKTRSDIDVELARTNNYDAAWRMNEDMSFVEAMNQQFASDLVYATTATTPEKFDGLSKRYGAPSTVRNNDGYYMITGGGSGSVNTSIWMLSLSPSDGVFGIYGKGGSAGMSMKDKGEVQAADRDGNLMDVFRTEFRWEVGLAVKRPGAVVRICNIDKTALVTNSSPADLSLLLQKAYNLIEEGLGKKVILCNKTTKAWLGIQASLETTLGLHNTKDTLGQPILSFWDAPILTMDAITNAEATIAGTFQSDI